jgi:hypothetical protein
MRRRKRTRSQEFNPAKERRMLDIMATGREIARELGFLRELLNEERLSHRDRDTVKVRLLNAADRLTNLLNIVMSYLEGAVLTDQRRQQIEDDIAFLRDHIDRLGTGLLVERVQAIGVRAERILTDEDYPLGCVYAIRGELIDLLATIGSITARSGIKDGDRQTLDSVVSLFNELVEIEIDLGIPNFAPPGFFDPLKPISIEDLALYANAA